MTSDYYNECHVAADKLFHKTKNAKTQHLSSITLGWIFSRKGGKQGKDLKRARILFDSGCGGTLVNKHFVHKYKKPVALLQLGQLKLEALKDR